MSGLLSIEPVELGFLVGFFPCLSMFGASVILTNYTVSPHIEACFQNFCAGLIIAAVAGELFPLLNDGASAGESAAGEIIGFVCGLGLIFGVEYIIDQIASAEEQEDALIAGVPAVSELSLTEAGGGHWEVEPIIASSQAIASPHHRRHILHHLEELMEDISRLETTSYSMLCQAMTTTEAENAAENVDEEVHKVQYKLDHCRRLLQGSESGVHGVLALSEDQKANLHNTLKSVKGTLSHLVEHMQADEFDMHTLQEIHAHMDEMDTSLAHFHHSVESTAFRWRRSRPFPLTILGAKIPMKLVVPVLIDACTDGFLIGVTCGVSPRAGLILGFANCLEMAFLGMALSTRVAKCTGSPLFQRYAAIVVPPLSMFLAAGLGAAIGGATKSIPILYVAFVAFGVVALLFLVCNELLIEAREAQGEDTKWWITIMIFAGILVILMLDHVIPA